MKMISVLQIVKQYLRKNGFDGLACDGCGCGLDDLMPCVGDITGMVECKPAKRYACDGTCSGCLSEGPDDRSDYCYRTVPVSTGEEETHL